MELNIGNLVGFHRLKQMLRNVHQLQACSA